MKEFFQKHGILFFVLLCSIFTLASLLISKLDRERVAYIAAVKHINIVTTVDRNCNDCHLGDSFLNLFNHAAVKGNDNIVTNMMDKAHIKRW